MFELTILHIDDYDDRCCHKIYTKKFETLEKAVNFFTAIELDYKFMAEKVVASKYNDLNKWDRDYANMLIRAYLTSVNEDGDYESTNYEFEHSFRFYHKVFKFVTKYSKENNYD